MSTEAGRESVGPDFGGPPRRIRRDLWTPAERAIYDAIQAVEDAGADERLTDAVILLGRAKDRVGDYVDGIVAGRFEPDLVGRLRRLVNEWRREARTSQREWEMGGHPSSAGAYTALDVCADALDTALKDEP